MKRVNRKKSAVSTFIATLILMILAVSAGVVIYTYTMGYLGNVNMKPNEGGILQVQSVAQFDGELHIYAKNIGKGTVKIDPADGLARVYVNDVDVRDWDPPLTYSPDPPEVLEGVTSDIVITGFTIDDVGKTATIKIVTADGTFALTNVKITQDAVGGVTPVLTHFVFDTIGSQVPGTPFSITITAKDQYGATLTTYAGTAGLSYSDGTISPTTTTGGFTDGIWTGDVTLTGTGTGVHLTATDGSVTDDSNTFNVNLAPAVLTHFVFNTISSPQTSGAAFSIMITAKDQYGATLTTYAGTADLSYSAGSIIPTSATGFSSGVWTGDVTLTGTGTTVSLTATDGSVTDNSNSFDVNPPANTPPVLDLIGNKSGDELTLITFTATATDADVPAQTLTFSLQGTPPTGASITTGGVFTWTPAEDQDGAHSITVRVTDDGSPNLYDEETITVTVSEVNLAPTVTAIDDVTSHDELTELAFTATATDPDIPANTLTFSLVVPDHGASITAGGDFSWTPTEEQGPGDYDFTVRVSDGDLTDDETFSVHVSEVTVQYQVTFQLSGLSSDASGTVLTVGATTYSYSELPLTGIWVDDGTTFSYTGTVSAGSGKQYVSTGVSGGLATPIHAAGSATGNYKTQYKHTITSSPATGSGYVTVDGGAVATPYTTPWWDSGSSHTIAANSPVTIVSDQSQYIYSSWSDSGAQSHSVSPTAVTTYTASFQLQYYFSVTSARDSPTGQGWYNAGSSVSSTVTRPVSGGAGTQYETTGWTGTGSLSSGGSAGSSSTGSFTINAYSTCTWNWKTQYQISFVANPSNGGSTSPTGTNIWEDAGSLPISATVNSGYKFSSWSSSTGSITFANQNPSTTATISGSGTITANFVPDHIALDGSAVGSVSGGNTITMTLTTTNPNDILYLSVVLRDSRTATVSGGGLTWTQRATRDGNDNVRLGTWYAKWSSSGAIEITISLSGSSTDAAAVAFGVSGANYADPFNGGATSNDGDGTSASVSKSSVNVNDFVIGALGVNSNPTLTKGSGFILIQTRAAGSSRETSDEYQIVSTSGTYTAGYSWSGNQGWAMIADAIKQAP